MELCNKSVHCRWLSRKSCHFRVLFVLDRRRGSKFHRRILPYSSPSVTRFWTLRDHRPWNTLGHVDTAIYGVPSSGVTRHEILKKYEVYEEAVLGKYGQKPNVRDVAKPLLSLFYAQPGNSLWKCKANTAFLHCKTRKSFFEETLVAIPDYVLDAPVGAPPSGFKDPFADIHCLLPPPYESREQELQYA